MNHRWRNSERESPFASDNHFVVCHVEQIQLNIIEGFLANHWDMDALMDFPLVNEDTVVKRIAEKLAHRREQQRFPLRSPKSPALDISRCTSTSDCSPVANVWRIVFSFSKFFGWGSMVRSRGSL